MQPERKRWKWEKAKDVRLLNLDFATTKKHGGVTLNIDADSEEDMRWGFRDSKSAKSKKEVALREIALDFKIAKKRWTVFLLKNEEKGSF